MQEIDKELIRKRMGSVLEALKKNRFEAHFFETAAEAKRFILDQIQPGETVGIGGSVTLREDLPIIPDIRKKVNQVFDHWEANDDPKRRIELKRSHRGVDVFLSSLNAITMDGTMVNLDGGGNRVASLCSGPKRVIAVAGTNKLVDSVDDAIQRTRNHAAVLRVLRSKFKTPCEVTGVCSDCDSPQRICSALLILFKKPADIDRFTVVLVNEEMGY
jgi:hypothetical protein